MVTDTPPGVDTWIEVDLKPGFSDGDKPVYPGDPLQPNDIVKIGPCVECICHSGKGLDCHDVTTTWTDYDDACVTHTCVKDNVVTENKADSCSARCNQGEKVETRPYPECCTCIPVVCTMTTDTPPGVPVWVEKDNKTGPGPGPTEGDKIITPGVPILPDEKVQLGYCKECVCVPGQPLNCYDIENTWVSPDDPCLTNSCIGSPVNKSASCKCPEGSELILAPPEDCCGCDGIPPPEKCTIDGELSVYDTAWTENNPDVQPGYELSPGETLHVGQCKECRCTMGGSLRCSEFKGELPTYDPCVIITCTPSYETSPFYKAESCECNQDEVYLEVEAPVCCRCVPTKCAVTATDMKTGKTPYIEQDGVAGLSDGDTRLAIGDTVPINQTIAVDECNECRCTDNGKFTCYNITKYELDPNDNCRQLACINGTQDVIDNADRCDCLPQYVVLLPYPLCCKCPPPLPSTTGPPTPTTTLSPCKLRMDLAFVLDGSGSICENTGSNPYDPCDNWRFILRFINEILDGFTIGLKDTRVTLETFARKIDIPFDFNKYTDYDSLSTAIENTRFPSGASNIADAIESLVTTIFNASHGDRPDVQNTAIVFTDGDPTANLETVKKAIDDVRRSGINVIVVGVTNRVSESTVKEISSPPQELNKNYFIVNDFSAIEAIRWAVQAEACNTPPPEVLCTMDDVQPGETLWIEQDNIPGLTSGDTVIYPGDTVGAYEVVKKGDCEECICELDQSLKCQPVLESWADETAPCTSHTCKDGQLTVVDHTQTCNCKEDETLVEADAPECCRCKPPNYCVMSTTDIPTDKPVWIERDNVPGPTPGDTFLNPGDKIETTDIVKQGDCKSCVCKPGKGLTCTDIVGTWSPTDNQCLVYNCDNEVVQDKTTLCNCSEGVASEPADHPACCKCQDVPPGDCTATVKELTPGERAWTDTNDDVQDGDVITLGDVLHVGDCKKCVCTGSDTFNCYPKVGLISQAGCSAKQCDTNGQVVIVDKSSSCVCKKGEKLVRLLADPCCTCPIATCLVEDDLLIAGKVPYIEKDGLIGFTSGDQVIHVGDRVDHDQTIIIDECNKCRCTETNDFKCYDLPTPEVSDSDKCQSYACESGFSDHWNRTESCDCDMAFLVALSHPKCCACNPVGSTSPGHTGVTTSPINTLQPTTATGGTTVPHRPTRPTRPTTPSQFCTMTTKLLPPDQPAWVEKDNTPGPTEGDRIIYPGDPVGPDEKVQLGNCQECICVPGKPLGCYTIPNTWISPDDPCIIESCIGDPINKSASCKLCPEGSNAIAAQPEDCCGCDPPRDTCIVDDDDLITYFTAYTDNNPDVQSGDELFPGEILHVSECKECLCTSSGSLSCHEVKTPLDTPDECVIVTCTATYERDNFFKEDSCKCEQDEKLVILPAPVCCQCLSTSTTTPAWGTTGSYGSTPRPGWPTIGSPEVSTQTPPYPTVTPGTTRPPHPHGSTGQTTVPTGSITTPVYPGTTKPTRRPGSTAPPRLCTMISDLPPDAPNAWIEVDKIPGFTDGDKPVYPGDVLQPNDVVKVGQCLECICNSQKGLDCHDISNTWTDEADACTTHTCVHGSVVTESKAESCSNRCGEGETVETRPSPECCACVPVVCTMTTDTPPGVPVWVEKDNKTGPGPGPTEGDKIITPGVPILPDEKVQLGYCKECICVPGKPLSCYDIQNTWPSPENPCIELSCIGNPVNKSASCICPEGSKLILAPPEDCCGCDGVPSASKCTVTVGDLDTYETAYTADNPDVQPGDELKPGDVLRVSTCKECRCTSSGILSCSMVNGELPSNDPCIITTCTPFYETSPFFKAESCECTDDEEYLVLDAPVCCDCPPTKCTVSETDVKPDKTPYIEQDGVDGYTSGDKGLAVGDKVPINETIRVDECNECRCTDSGKFSCYSITKTETDPNDLCRQVSCVNGTLQVIDNADRCDCPLKYRIELPYPQCCDCPPQTTTTGRPIGSTTPTRPTPPATTLPPCKLQMDLAILIDGSGSICEKEGGDPSNPCSNWKFVLSFVNELLQGFTIGPKDTRVSLLTFARSIDVPFNFTQFDNYNSLSKAIENTRYPGGATNTADALSELVSTVFTESHGDRPDVQNTAIMLTDGDPTVNVGKLDKSIDDVRRQGINVIVVGVTEAVSNETIKKISSPPHKFNKNYFIVNDFSSIEAIRWLLQSQACETPPPPVFCTMDDIEPGEKVWIERDDIPGLTSGDTVINPGDIIEVDDVVKKGDCQECICEMDQSLYCQPVSTSWTDENAPCTSHVCKDGELEVIDRTQTCNCKEDETLVESAAEECCRCIPPDYCVMTTNDIPTDIPVWIEKDNVPGPTPGDTFVSPGDTVGTTDVIKQGDCRSCVCEPGKGLTCSNIDGYWSPVDDKCLVYNCDNELVQDKTTLCNCLQGVDSEPADFPACCSCPGPIGDCQTTVNELTPGESAWTDTNDDVQDGDVITFGDVLHVGDCRECICIGIDVFNCYPKVGQVSKDGCSSKVCDLKGQLSLVDSTGSCKCEKGETLVRLPNEPCCRCEKGHCTVVQDVVKADKIPYIEQDGVKGFTAGDKALKVGDPVDRDQILIVDECHKCRCTEKDTFACFNVSVPEVPQSDPCQSYICSNEELYHINKTEICDCPLEQLVALSAPRCCRCTSTVKPPWSTPATPGTTRVTRPTRPGVTTRWPGGTTTPSSGVTRGPTKPTRPGVTTRWPGGTTTSPIEEFCTMTTDIPPDQPVWIEQDNIPGPTQGDRIIYPGDLVDPNEKVQLGYCKECVCEPGKPLSCYPNLQTWVSPEDPCIVESCLGNPVNKSASCKCAEGSELILAPPDECCGCYPSRDTCSVDADDLSVYETAWTENNPDVQPGDELSPGEILHVGQCKEW